MDDAKLVEYTEGHYIHNPIAAFCEHSMLFVSSNLENLIKEKGLMNKVTEKTMHFQGTMGCCALGVIDDGLQMMHQVDQMYSIGEFPKDCIVRQWVYPIT